jgi:hypothetical protein
MEGIFFLIDVVLMLVLLYGVLKGERGQGEADGKADLGFFAYKERAEEDR